MAASINVIWLLVLLTGGHLLEIQAFLLRGYQSDRMLDKIATDVVADVVQQAKTFAENKNKTGLPSVPPIDTKFSMAGIEFQIQARHGVFKSFPSLRIAGETKMNYRLQNRSHVVRLYIPVTFEDFTISFDVTVSVGNSVRKGNLTIRAKSNKFLTVFRIAHSPKKCTVSLKKVRTLAYSSVDFDIELQGMPHLHMTNISNTVSNRTRTEEDYEMVMLERVFDIYFAAEETTTTTNNNNNNDNNNNSSGPFAYCTYVARPYIKRLSTGGTPNMMGLQKRFGKFHLNQRKVRVPIRPGK